MKRKLAQQNKDFNKINSQLINAQIDNLTDKLGSFAS